MTFRGRAELAKAAMDSVQQQERLLAATPKHRSFRAPLRVPVPPKRREPMQFRPWNRG